MTLRKYRPNRAYARIVGLLSVVNFIWCVGCSSPDPLEFAVKQHLKGPTAEVKRKVAQVKNKPERNTTVDRASEWIPAGGSTDISNDPDRADFIPVTINSEFVPATNDKSNERADDTKLKANQEHELVKLLREIATLKRDCKFFEAEKKCQKAYAMASRSKEEHPRRYLLFLTELMETYLINHKVVEAVRLDSEDGRPSQRFEVKTNGDVQPYLRYCDLRYAAVALYGFPGGATREIRNIESTRKGISRNQNLDIDQPYLLRAVNYLRLFEFEKARDFFEKGLHQAGTRFGEQDVKYAEALVAMSEYFNEIDNLPLVEQQLQRAIDIYEKQPDSFHREYSRALCLLKLSSHYYERKSFQNAWPLCVEGCEILKGCVGADHPSYIDALWLKGKMVASQGKLSEFSMSFTSVVAFHRDAVGTSNIDTVSFLSEMAGVSDYLRNLSRANKWRQASMKALADVIAEPEAGPFLESSRLFICYSVTNTQQLSDLLEEWASKEEIDYRFYSTCLDRLGQQYFDEGKLGEALETFNESLALKTRIWGLDHYRRIQSLRQIGYCHLKMGDYLESLIFTQQALELTKHTTGKQSIAYADALLTVAGSYHSLERFEQAASCQRQALDIYKKWMKKDDALLIAVSVSLANVLAELGEFQQAEDLHNHYFSLQNEKYGKTSRSYYNGVGISGLIQFHQKKYGYAEELLSDAIDGIEANERYDKDGEIFSFLIALGKINVQNGNLEKAESLLASATTITDEFASKHPLKAEAFHFSGTLEMIRGKHADALASFNESLEIRELRFGKDHPLIVETLMSLAKLHTQMKEPDKATEYRTRAEAIENK